MDKNVWTHAIIDVSSRISDSNYQKSAWFGIGDKVSSPIEFYCELFDDLIFDDFLSSGRVELTDYQHFLGVRLKKMMDDYGDSIDYLDDPQRVYIDPKWDCIRHAAKDFIDAF